MNVLDLQHGLQQRHHVFRFRGRQIEGTDHQVLVLFLLLLGIGADDEQGRTGLLGKQAIAVQNQRQRLVERLVFQRDGNRIVAHILVEHKINVSRLPQRLHHFLQARIAKLQRDRLLLSVVAIDRMLLGGEPRHAFQRLFIGGVQLDGPHIAGHGFTHTPQLRKTFRFPIPVARFLQPQDLRQAGLMLLARRLDRQGALEFLGGLIELTVLQQLTTTLIMRRSRTLSGHGIFVL